MKTENQGMTAYQKKFMIALAMAQVGLTIFAISVFGQYYNDQITKWQSYAKHMTEKFQWLEKKCAVWHLEDSEYQMKKKEWDYNQHDGIGAEIVEEKK